MVGKPPWYATRHSGKLSLLPTVKIGNGHTAKCSDAL